MSSSSPPSTAPPRPATRSGLALSSNELTGMDMISRIKFIFSSCLSCPSLLNFSAFQRDAACRVDGGKSAQLFEGRVGGGRVGLDDGHRLAAALAPAEVEATDVDAVVAEDGADAADDAGYVAAPRQQHMARGDGLDAKPVDLRNAPVRARAEERARHRVL